MTDGFERSITEASNRSTRCRDQLKCDGTRAETRFRLPAKRTGPFKSARASVQSTTGSRGVRIGGSNVGYTMFWGSVKSTGYPLHSPVSPSLPHPYVAVCHRISTGVYQKCSATIVYCENVLCALKFHVRLFNVRSTSSITVIGVEWGVWRERGAKRTDLKVQHVHGAAKGSNEVNFSYDAHHTITWRSKTNIKIYMHLHDIVT